MRCPMCQRQTVYEGNPFRPFCSERCKLIDLDNWFSGRYRVSAPAASPEESAETEGSAGGEFDESNPTAGE
jgi:uncharacterized protein